MMSTRPAHTVKRIIRHMVAAGMTVLYLMIIFSPVASFALHGTKTAVRQCSGDCNICGCSPQSRSANTCCCAKQRQQEAHAHEDDGDEEFDCCKNDRAEKKTVVIACGCPCDSGKQTALSAPGTSEVLPFQFAERLVIPHTDTLYSPHPQRLTSRHGEPPDPPPQNSRIC